jgi:hypothetical protein
MSGNMSLLTDLEAQMAACADMQTPELWKRFGGPQNCLIAISDYLSSKQKNHVCRNFCKALVSR